MKRFILMIIGVVLLCSLTACTTGFSFGSSIMYPNADKYTAGNVELSDKVEKLEVEWTSGDVAVVTTQTGTLSVSEEIFDGASNPVEDVPDEMRVHWWLDGTTLHIKYCESKFRLTSKSYRKSLTVAVPGDFALSEVTVCSASADVTVDGIEAETVTVETASGEPNVTCAAAHIRINTSSGDVTLVNTCDAADIEVATASGLQNLTVQKIGSAVLSTSSGDVCLSATASEKLKIGTSSGKVTCEVEEVPQKCSVSTSSGDVKLKLPADAGITMKVYTSSGKFESALAMKKTGDTYTSGDGKAEFEVGTSSGNIEILAR